MNKTKSLPSFAMLLAGYGYDVALWGAYPEYVELLWGQTLRGQAPRDPEGTGPAQAAPVGTDPAQALEIGVSAERFGKDSGKIQEMFGAGLFAIISPLRVLSVFMFMDSSEKMKVRLSCHIDWLDATAYFKVFGIIHKVESRRRATTALR